MDKDFEDKVQKFTTIVSLVLLLLGLFVSIIIIFKLINNKVCLCENEILLAGWLIGAGLLGSVFGYVLKAIIKDYVTKYCQDEIIELIKTEVYENQTEQKYENAYNDEIEKGIIQTGFDTVIVPISKTYNDVLVKNEYECPSEYKFKDGLKYIAFYLKKKVIGYGEISNDYQINVDGLKYFKFKNFINRDISHKPSGAFIQNKMYCNIEDLRKAKDTSEIRSRK